MAKPNDIKDWISKATVYETISLAIRMERGAIQQYSRMASAADSPLIRAKLRYLTEEERDHARILAAMRRNLPVARRSRSLPVYHLAEADEAPIGALPADVLRLAVSNERSAESFYRLCASRCRRAAARKLFQQLAEREVRHRELLEDELNELTGVFAWRSLEDAPPVEKDFWG